MITVLSDNDRWRHFVELWEIWIFYLFHLFHLPIEASKKKKVLRILEGGRGVNRTPPLYFQHNSFDWYIGKYNIILHRTFLSKRLAKLIWQRELELLSGQFRKSSWQKYSTFKLFLTDHDRTIQRWQVYCRKRFCTGFLALIF